MNNFSIYEDGYLLISKKDNFVLLKYDKESSSEWQFFIVKITNAYVAKFKYYIAWNYERFSISRDDELLKIRYPDAHEWARAEIVKNFTFDKSEIQSISESRKIPCLVHFTKISNLGSIIKNGILSKERLIEKSIDFTVNDLVRLDGYLDAISLSISFPNYKMLYKYMSQDSASSWVILILDPSILWKVKCAFCKHNAADIRISKSPIENLMNGHSFSSMFDDIVGVDGENRVAQHLMDYDPTDVQAEILVFEKINTSFINSITFVSRQDLNNYSSLVSNIPCILHGHGKGLFASRTYARSNGFRHN